MTMKLIDWRKNYKVIGAQPFNKLTQVAYFIRIFALK